MDHLDISGPSDLDFLGPAGVQNESKNIFKQVPQGATLDFRNAVQKFEKNLLLNALDKSQWQKAKAAAMLNLPRRTFFRKLREYELI